MSAIKLRENIWSVGIQNPALRVFDIVMESKYGTTYNAYLVTGGEKTALIEAVHKDYFDELVRNVEEVMPIEKVDYLIMNHTEPDHSGGVRALHPCRRHGDAQGVRSGPQGEGVRGGGTVQHRGQAYGHAAPGRPRHRHYLPFPDKRPGRSVPPG